MNDLFHLRLCWLVYDFCNGIQFKSMRATDFADFLNLKPTTKPVVVQSREKIRVCYLIYALSLEIRDRSMSMEWRKNSLSSCGIGEGYYGSHYLDCRAAGTSNGNKTFADEIDDIIKSERRRQ